MPGKPPATDELFEVLAVRVRVLSLGQVSRTWWPDVSPATARSRLERLRASGLVDLHRRLAREELDLLRPLATWEPGQETPSLASVARCAQTRWSTPPRSTLCVVATTATGVRFAGRGGRPPRESEWTHDLQLSQVYLHFRAHAPRRAARWQHEDLAERPKSTSPRPGEKLPDAIIHDDGRAVAVEIVGNSYGREKLEAFHSYCDERRLPYELW